MDNLTHTLIGVATAHSLPEKYRKPSLYWALLIGNNLPDSDFIQSLLPGSTGLDYLIHHRGYTHSLFIAIPLATVGAWIAARLSRQNLSREIYLFTLLGCWMHVAADFLNNYGVHPFSPFSNRWFYGDTLFIVEPLLWLGILPAAFFLARSRWAKGFWALLWTATAGLAITSSLVPLGVKAVVLALNAASAGIHFRTKHARAAFAWIVIVIATFGICSRFAKEKVRSELSALTSGSETIRDIDSTPAPGNPFCWHSWTVTENADSYRFRAIAVSIAPALSPLSSCGPVVRMAPKRAESVPMSDPGAVASAPSVRWLHENSLSKALMNETLDRSCLFARLMSFVRFPFLKKLGENEWMAGDLRYDQRESDNFTAVRFITGSRPPGGCGKLNAPWESPFYRD